MDKKKIYEFNFKMLYYAKDEEEAREQLSTDLSEPLTLGVTDSSNWHMIIHPNKGQWAWAYRDYEEPKGDNDVRN